MSSGSLNKWSGCTEISGVGYDTELLTVGVPILETLKLEALKQEPELEELEIESLR